MLNTIAHAAMLRLAKARCPALNGAPTVFKEHMTAARTLRALFSVSPPVRAAVKAYLLFIWLVSALSGAGGLSRWLGFADGLPLLRALNQLIFSWLDLCGSAEEAARL